MLLPFLPGSQDGLALPLSTMAQASGVLGPLLLPAGIPWLVYELRKQAQRRRGLPVQPRRLFFMLAALAAASVVVLGLSLVGLATVGLSWCVLVLALWLYIVTRIVPGLRREKAAETERLHPAPLHLVFLPVAVLAPQLALAGPVTDFSRSRAIAQAAELIRDLEAHRAREGRYPASLAAVWKDYQPSVAGIERFRYAPNGEADDLFFEQPRFLLDNPGTREFVVYNPRDQHVMISHASWILLLPAEELRRNQGWYAMHDVASPHWKRFFFD
ncbi:MAG: hypothetical protein ACKVYV_11425 [Limisphaerales bacterium]